MLLLLTLAVDLRTMLPPLRCCDGGGARSQLLSMLSLEPMTSDERLPASSSVIEL